MDVPLVFISVCFKSHIFRCLFIVLVRLLSFCLPPHSSSSSTTTTNTRFYWGIITFFASIYAIFASPLWFAFCGHIFTPFIYLDYAVDILFWFNFLFYARCFIVMDTQQSSLLVTPNQIWTWYCSSWDMLLDLIPIVPVDMIGFVYLSQSGWFVVFALRLTRVLHILRVSHRSLYIQNSYVLQTSTWASSVVRRSLWLLFLLLAGAHVFACLWFALGVQQASSCVLFGLCVWGGGGGVL
jgi:hypothetical protein